MLKQQTNPFHDWLTPKHAALYLRSKLIQSIRNFFISHDYLEIETPCRIPEPTPEAFIDSISSENWFLHTSPELCMKKLIASGLPRIFQICKCFRANERSDSHLSEFTLLEWYRTNINYNHLMDECEVLIHFISQQINHNDEFHYQGKRISLTPPWQRISVDEAFQSFGKISLNQALEKNMFDEIMVYDIEPALGIQPTFLYDYPKERGALARAKAGNPNLAERFELYIGGHELANAFSELIDPKEQQNRFESELMERKSFGKTVYPIPTSFLNALYHMPETAGIALGVDRLVMLFADTTSIDNIVAFTSEDLVK